MIKKEAERLELEKRKYIRGRFKELEDYREEVWHCNRCNMCKEVFGWYMKSNEFSDICPSFAFNKCDTYACPGQDAYRPGFNRARDGLGGLRGIASYHLLLRDVWRVCHKLPADNGE